MKNKFTMTNVKLLLPLVASIALSAAASFAWFSWLRKQGDISVIPGQLDSNFIVEKWISNNWQVDTNQVYLGEMNTISTLPANAYHYLKFKANEQSEAYVNYDILVEHIDLSITNEDGTFLIDDLDYYIDEPSLQAFDFYIHIGANGLNPTTIFANYQTMTPGQITVENQSFTNDAFVEIDDYLYVMLKARLAEIQNMVDVIPLEYTPYSIDFDFNYIAEVRTLDEI